MGTKKIYVASDEVSASMNFKQHLYLIYDPDTDSDGDPTTGDDVEIIRGGPSGTGLAVFADQIIVEVGVEQSQSDDAFDGETVEDRNLTELVVGEEAGSEWDDMKEAAKHLGTHNETTKTTTMDQIYYALGPNSNSVIRAVMEATGYNFDENLPKEGGNGSRMDLDEFTGQNVVLRHGQDGVNDTTGIEHGNGPVIIIDDSGQDEHIIPLGRTTWIIEDNNPETADSITIQGLNMGDAEYQRSGNDLVILNNGIPVVIVKDHFAPGVLGRPISNVNFDDGSVPAASFSPDAWVPLPLPTWVEGVTVPFGNACTVQSPLVLDLDGNGIELAAVNGAGSVYWDIDGDGMAEASGWMAGGDGVLCADANADGVIVQSELFGNDATYANGYLKLDAMFDSNSDNAITSADANFGSLRVWIDANADGYSQSAELYTLASLGITSISTTWTNVNYTIAGNDIKQESTFTINGNTRTSVDAWFAYDNVNTEYAGDYTLDIRTLFLPTLRGYGNLPDLHIAMSMDETLLGMVERCTNDNRKYAERLHGRDERKFAA